MASVFDPVFWSFDIRFLASLSCVFSVQLGGRLKRIIYLRFLCVWLHYKLINHFVNSMVEMPRGYTIYRPTIYILYNIHIYIGKIYSPISSSSATISLSFPSSIYFLRRIAFCADSVPIQQTVFFKSIIPRALLCFGLARSKQLVLILKSPDRHHFLRKNSRCQVPREKSLHY